MSPAVQKLYAFSLGRYFDLLRVVKGRPLALFFRDGGIGDILCTFPAAAALARQHANHHKIYCTNPAFVPLPKMVGQFDRVIGIRCNDLVAHAARRHKVFRFRYPDEDPNGASSQYLADEFSVSFGLPAGQPWPQLAAGATSPKVEALFSGADRRPALCLHTGPSWVVREWPRERWEALVPLLKTLNVRVLQVGASRHFREGERKEPPIAGVEDCRDVFDLVETMQIISKSRLLVGIDSGMIHAAVAFRVPVVGIFGPTSALLRLPRHGAVAATADVDCLGCHHRRPRLHWQSGCPYEARCMSTLSVERVFEKSAQIFAG
jgi:ADP-heptose:LPS heptosyltransferase